MIVKLGLYFGRKGKIPRGRPGITWENNIRMDVREMGGRVQNGFIWLRTGASGGLLWTRWWTFGFRKRRGISWPTERLL